MNKSELGSTILRMLSMASKFLILIFVAKNLTDRDAGTLNLMTQTIANGILLIGMQFFLFANRELAGAAEADRGMVIRNQIAFYACLYVVVLPTLLLVFFIHTLAWSLFGWFYAILISDHISYELQRMLASTRLAVKSNIIHTIRTGLWVYPLIAVMTIFPASKNLTAIWISWLAGSLLSVTLALFWLRGLGIRAAFDSKANWEWIIAGSKLTIKYIPVTIILVLTTLIDRFVLEHFHGLEIVGIYGLFVTVANIIVTFPEAGVGTVMGPKIINAYSHGRFAEHRALLKLFKKKLIISIIPLCLAAFIALFVAVNYYVKKAIYTQSFMAFVPLVGASIFVAIGMWPHYALYSRKMDNEIVKLSLFCAVFYIILLAISVPPLGIYGASCSVFFLHGSIFVWKLILANQADRRDADSAKAS